MTKQTPISLKLDNDILSDVDKLSKQLYCKLNRLINFACRVMCDNMLGTLDKTRLTYIYGLSFPGSEVE